MMFSKNFVMVPSSFIINSRNMENSNFKRFKVMSKIYVLNLQHIMKLVESSSYIHCLYNEVGSLF